MNAPIFEYEYKYRDAEYHKQGVVMSNVLYRANLIIDRIINRMEIEHWALCAVVLVLAGFIWLKKAQP